MIYISWPLEIFEPIDDQKRRLEFCFSIPQAVKLFHFPLFSILYQKFLSHIMISETFIYQKLSLFLYFKRNKNQLQPQQFRNWTKSFYCPPKTLSNPLTIVTRFDVVFHIWRLDAIIIYLINLSLIVTLQNLKSILVEPQCKVRN